MSSFLRMLMSVLRQFPLSSMIIVDNSDNSYSEIYPITKCVLLLYLVGRGPMKKETSLGGFRSTTGCC